MTVLRLPSYPAPARSMPWPEPTVTRSPAEATRPQPEVREEPLGEEAPEQIEAELRGAVDGRFEVIGLIAVGGMARIFELRHVVHGGRFVAKVLDRKLAQRTEIVEAFYREARHAARLAGHPNVTPVLDLCEHEGLLYLLMPYVDGEDLDRVLLERGRLQRDEALTMLAQMASTLMYAESLGIVHGDLAPGNIRLDHFGQYKLLDFGLSFSTSEPTRRSYTAGTPAYNSPEHLRGETPDIRSDLYSLGAILFEVLTGRPMFQAPNLDELALCHLDGVWTSTPEIDNDAAVAALIRSLVAPDREVRMRSAFELSGALATLGYELPSFHRAFATANVQPPRARRRRLL